MKYFALRMFVNQHRVLEKIYDAPSVREFLNVKEIAEQLQLDEEDVMQAAHLLKGRGFANVKRDKKPFVVECTPDGAQALMQKTLLTEGREKAKADLLRWVQVFGIVVASVISVVSFIINTFNTVNNTNSIEALKTEIESLKMSQLNPKPKSDEGKIRIKKVAVK